MKNTSVIKKENTIRDGIIKFENELSKIPGVLIGDSPQYLDLCPLKHTFVDGAYVRELFMPKGILFVTKIHKITHPYFLMKGDCSVLTENGIKRIKAPFSGVTLSGTKRIIYTHADTVWITVHVTKERDLKKIEDEIIAKTYDDLPDNIIDVEAETITNFISEVSKKEGEVNATVSSAL